MDEYVGIDPNHPEESYRTFMHENFFNHVDIQAENINLLDGKAEDIDAHTVQHTKRKSVHTAKSTCSWAA